MEAKREPLTVFGGKSACNMDLQSIFMQPFAVSYSRHPWIRDGGLFTSQHFLVQNISIIYKLVLRFSFSNNRNVKYILNLGDARRSFFYKPYECVFE